MQLGMVGLGRMGANMTRRLMRGGHQLVVSDLSPDAVKQLAGEGAGGSSSLEDLIAKLTPLLTTAVNNKQITAAQKTEILQRLQTGPIPFWNKPVPHKKPLPAITQTN